jgi:amylosucrase
MNDDGTADRALSLVLPRLQARFPTAESTAWDAFEGRLHAHFPDLFEWMLGLYGTRYDFFYYLEEVLATTAAAWLVRPDDLKTIDTAREAEPGWFQSERMMGAMGYVDLQAGTLTGVSDLLSYFDELGLTYLHLMPLFKSPDGPNDGGYAVSSYREVAPHLGTVADLRSLAAELHDRGIALVLDFVFNHTSDEHEWALAARRGNPPYTDFYYLFPDRSGPDRYALTLRDIFPQERQGSFTYLPDVECWVWTTFHSYQWDLNYSNPEVFVRMAGEMLALANLGVDILRLDAVAFAWKQEGTPSESLPQVHLLTRAFNAVARIGAPGLLFKSEAIVHPAQVASYISPNECQLSYNPLLMALLWEALATRQVRLLWVSLSRYFAIDPGCAWVEYVRSHDDIGWTFDDADAQRLGIDPYAHRQFLNAFYTGRFPGSFARGLPFEENERTGDMRISGTLASLAGLQAAIDAGDPAQIDTAIDRMLLLWGIVLSIGGIPLLYLGDELGALNDNRYAAEPNRAADSRWAHRPHITPEMREARHVPTAISARIFRRLMHLISARQTHPAFAGQSMTLMTLGHEHILGYLRPHDAGSVAVLANFSEHPQPVGGAILRDHGLAEHMHDLVTDGFVEITGIITLAPYALHWLVDAPPPQPSNP